MKNKMMKFAVLAIMDEMDQMQVECSYEEYVKSAGITFEYFEHKSEWIENHIDAHMIVCEYGEPVYAFQFAISR